MKKLFIYCDGGFGNRYGTLLGGLAVSNYYNLIPIVNWRNTSACRLSFDEIFDNKLILVIDEPLQNFSDCILMMHQDFVIGKKNYNINSFSGIQSLPISDEDDYVYNNNWIPEWMDEDTVIHSGKMLPFKSSYFEASNKFIEDNGIDEFTIGVHLRATDFDTVVPKFDREYRWIQSQPENKFFVLSDDKSTEQKFNQLDNVIVRQKEHYVEKVNENSSWCDNVERTKESVIDSLIDLTILSKTNMIVNSPSSFLKTSLLLKKING